MKHLRYINENVEYYQEITHDEFFKRYRDRNDEVDFTSNEVKELELRYKFKSDFHTKFIRKSLIRIPINYNNTISVRAHKYKDEWFYVESANEYFKCDQFSGLLKLVDSLFNDFDYKN